MEFKKEKNVTSTLKSKTQKQYNLEELLSQITHENRMMYKILCKAFY